MTWRWFRTARALHRLMRVRLTQRYSSSRRFLLQTPASHSGSRSRRPNGMLMLSSAAFLGFSKDSQDSKDDTLETESEDFQESHCPQVPKERPILQESSLPQVSRETTGCCCSPGEHGCTTEAEPLDLQRVPAIPTEEVDASIQMFKQVTCTMKPESPCSCQWSLVIDKPNMKLWKRTIPGTSINHFRVVGRVLDVPASAFFKVQLEDGMRMQVDRYIRVIRSTPVGGALGGGGGGPRRLGVLDHVTWVHNFPFPLNPRCYSYVRRAVYRSNDDSFVIISKSLPRDAECDNSDLSSALDRASEDFIPRGTVDVDTYYSSMVIKPLPGRAIGDPGFDYMLSYIDDQKTVLPKACVSFVTAEGIPNFIKSICLAAKQLYESDAECCNRVYETYSDCVCKDQQREDAEYFELRGASMNCENDEDRKSSEDPEKTNSISDFLLKYSFIFKPLCQNENYFLS